MSVSAVAAAAKMKSRSKRRKKKKISKAEKAAFDAQVTAFYQKYSPNRMDTVPTIVEKYVRHQVR